MEHSVGFDQSIRGIGMCVEEYPFHFAYFETNNCIIITNWWHTRSKPVNLEVIFHWSVGVLPCSSVYYLTSNLSCEIWLRTSANVCQVTRLRYYLVKSWNRQRENRTRRHFDLKVLFTDTWCLSWCWWQWYKLQLRRIMKSSTFNWESTKLSQLSSLGCWPFPKFSQREQ